MLWIPQMSRGRIKSNVSEELKTEQLLLEDPVNTEKPTQAPRLCPGLGAHGWRYLPVSRRFPGDPSSTSESPQVLRDLFLGCRRVSNLGRTTDKKVLVPS